MTPDEFRSYALSLPEATEQAHHKHPDFRVGKKVFATLAPDGSWAMVKLPPDVQSERVASAPDVFEPFAGAWGRQGCTRLHLAQADEAAAMEALVAAWRNVAPKRLVREFDRDNA